MALHSPSFPASSKQIGHFSAAIEAYQPDKQRGAIDTLHTQDLTTPCAAARLGGSQHPTPVNLLAVCHNYLSFPAPGTQLSGPSLYWIRKSSEAGGQLIEAVPINMLNSAQCSTFCDQINRSLLNIMKFLKIGGPTGLTVSH